LYLLLTEEKQDIAQKDQSLPQTKRQTLVTDRDDSEDEYKPRWYCKSESNKLYFKGT
jgi:hypothetical protein